MENGFDLESLLVFHGFSLDGKSYVYKASMVLPSFTCSFTVPQLSRRAGIPRSKGYPTIQQIEDLRLVEKVPKTPRPNDWHEYTRSQRKRFNMENGLPVRGLEPQRYRFCPGKAVEYAGNILGKRVMEIDRDAMERIRELNGIYRHVCEAFSSTV